MKKPFAALLFGSILDLKQWSRIKMRVVDPGNTTIAERLNYIKNSK